MYVTWLLVWPSMKCYRKNGSDREELARTGANYNPQ